MKLTPEQIRALAKVIQSNPGLLAAFDQAVAEVPDLAAWWTRLPPESRDALLRAAEARPRGSARER